MEGWLSGRKHLTANEASGKTLRGFESLTFRKTVRASCIKTGRRAGE